MNLNNEELKKILPSNGPNIDEVSKYIKKYKDEIITIKYGGNVFIDKQIFDNFINYKQRLGDYSTIHPVKFWKKMHSYKKIFVLGSYSRKLEGKRERMINISARGDSRKIFENFHNLEFHWD